MLKKSPFEQWKKKRKKKEKKKKQNTDKVVFQTEMSEAKNQNA